MIKGMEISEPTATDPQNTQPRQVADRRSAIYRLSCQPHLLPYAQRFADGTARVQEWHHPHDSRTRKADTEGNHARSSPSIGWLHHRHLWKVAFRRRRRVPTQSSRLSEVFIHGGGGIGQIYPGSCGDAPATNTSIPPFSTTEHLRKDQGVLHRCVLLQSHRMDRSAEKIGQAFFAYIPTNAPMVPTLLVRKIKPYTKGRGFLRTPRVFLA